MWKKILVISMVGVSLGMGVGQVRAVEWASGTGECHDSGWDTSSITCADGQAVQEKNDSASEIQYCGTDAVNSGNSAGECRYDESSGGEGNRCFYCPNSVDQLNNAAETKGFDLCEDLQAVDVTAFNKCDTCQKNGGYWSAIGCVPTDSVELVAYLVRIALGIGGVLLTAQIVISAVQIIFASGDSGAMNAAKKRLTNSLIAIGFMIFGIAVLQIVGVQILHIPGFFGT